MTSSELGSSVVSASFVPLTGREPSSALPGSSNLVGRSFSCIILQLPLLAFGRTAHRLSERRATKREPALTVSTWQQCARCAASRTSPLALASHRSAPSGRRALRESSESSSVISAIALFDHGQTHHGAGTLRRPRRLAWTFTLIFRSPRYPSEPRDIYKTNE